MAKIIWYKDKMGKHMCRRFHHLSREALQFATSHAARRLSAIALFGS